MQRKQKHSILALLISLILMILACGLPSQSGAGLSISVLAPLQVSTFGVGETIEVHFRAEGDSTIARVDMSLDGALIATQEGGPSPYEGSFMWTPSEAGTYNLILTAYDDSNTASAPAGVSVIVEGAVVEEPEEPKEPEEVEEPKQEGEQQLLVGDE